MTDPPPAAALRYPDNGEQFEDASMLRNAASFVTARRAHAARLVLDKLDSGELPDGERAPLRLQAFEADMTSTEDTIGWLFVLRDWNPGSVEGSVLFLLDRVKVGVGKHAEDKVLDLLNSLDVNGLRELLHLPSAQQLRHAGFPDDLINSIEQALPSQLAGLRDIAEYRQRDDRARVRAFNKAKHMLLGGLSSVDGELQVQLVHRLGLQADGVHLENTFLSITPDAIRRSASRAITRQAALSTMLSTVLWVRFGAPLETPQWAIDALDLPGWKDDGPVAPAES